MHARLLTKLGVMLSAAAVLTRSPQSRAPLRPAQGEERIGVHSNQAALIRPMPLAAPTPAAPTANLRVQFRQSRNYAEFVREVSAAAGAGDPIAEYLTAKALKYCHDNAHWRTSAPGGPLRTRDELEIRTGKYPASLQQGILEAYDRCQEFWLDPGQADRTAGWGSWLDRAAEAGYPPAQSLQADGVRVAEMMRDSANATSGEAIPPRAGPARDLAIGAVLSGDPDSIFEMMNWVDGSKRSGEESWVLSSAWGLLACQRGYDGCDPASPWLRSICSWDVQCADDASVIDTLRRQLGSRFDDAQHLADEIGHAIDNQDATAIESHL